MHSVLPESEEYVFTGQGVHALSPVVVPMVPSGQGAHAGLLFVEYLPFAQVRQPVAPLELYLPDPQSLQDD